jgi:hypothetical protein
MGICSYYDLETGRWGEGEMDRGGDAATIVGASPCVCPLRWLVLTEGVMNHATTEARPRWGRKGLGGRGAGSRNRQERISGITGMGVLIWDRADKDD